MVTAVGLPITKSTCLKRYNKTSQDERLLTSGSTPVRDVSQATMMPLQRKSRDAIYEIRCASKMIF
jgi:hypothetical protein